MVGETASTFAHGAFSPGPRKVDPKDYPFAGSGSTLTRHKCGRRAWLVEFDPAYCDQIVRRFEQLTGKQAILAATGQSFEVVAEERGLSPVPSW